MANLPDAKRGLSKDEVRSLLGSPTETGNRDGWDTYDYGPFRFKKDDFWYVMEGTVWFENGRSIRSVAKVFSRGDGKATIIGGQGSLTRDQLGYYEVN